ncbi:MAG: class I SAM-dependent methyltransferase, partial [Cyclobacteriaceae bacterium]
MAASQLNRFDRVASFYDRLTGFVFWGSLIKAQECNLEAISDNSDVLVLGGGTGNFLNKLLSRNNGCRIWYVEASQKMIERAKKNLNFTDRIIFIHGTHENLPEQKFDVVITHFFVDLFTEQELRAVSH